MAARRPIIGAGAGTVEIMVNPASVSNTLVTSDAVSLAGYDHLTLLLHFGAMHDSLDSDITIYGDTAAAATNNTALATIKYRVKVSTAAWGAMTSVSDSKLDVVAAGDIDPSTSDNCLVAIEIDAADILALSTTYDLKYVYFTVSAGGAYAYLLGAVAILSRGRYTDDSPASTL
jgi:hypothetical protein